jgi:translocation and assembly module TamA
MLLQLATPARSRVLACALLAISPALGAEPLRAVLVRGIEGDERANVLQSLSVRRLPKADRADLSEGRLSYLLRAADEEVREALRPYGYYEPKVESEVSRDARGITVTFTVTPGEPVTVTSAEIAMNGPAQRDAAVLKTLRAFEPRVGARLDHRLYEASKLAVQRRLIERGYFDADLLEHRIEVRQRERAAALKLRWESGQRYRFGEVRIEGAQVRTELLEQSIPFETGKPYHQRELLALHQRLTDLDYFGYIDVRPDPETAKGDLVPVMVAVTPGKRSVYTAGVSYGTDSGGGVQLGLERRWVNDRGHKLGAQIDYAQRRKSFGVLYRIPAFEWAEGWYAFGVNRREEESEFVESRISEIVAKRTGRLRGWNLGLSMHVLEEDFVLGHDPVVGRGSAQLVYPALSAERKESDDTLYPTRGYLLRGEVKVGAKAIGSETDFGQLLIDGKWIRSLGASNRLLLRGQIGRTFTDEFDELPPSLRFYAGGDRSIRGYGYQEVGPRVEDQVIGGKNLITGSVEFEHMFTEEWGGAVFVDAGDAFSEADEFRAHSGVGVGVRWRSPVGLVRVDIAHGIDDAENAVQFHINIGPDL